MFLKLFQLASQKWQPKSQIGWEYVPTVPIFLELCALYSPVIAELYTVRASTSAFVTIITANNRASNPFNKKNLLI